MDFREIQVDNEKKRLIEEIAGLLSLLCTGEKSSCGWGWCEHNGLCAKEYFVGDNLPKKKMRLRSMAKCLRSKNNKRIGRFNPSHLGNNIHEIASTLVGCNIYEHELVVGHQRTADKIKMATTLNQINQILDRRHIAKTGKSKLWHY